MRLDDYRLSQKPDWFSEYYLWPEPTITYSHTQVYPDALQPISHAQRYTGGGLVFHCPGDIVFCLIADYHHARLPKKLRDKVSAIQAHIHRVLTQHGIPVYTKPDTRPPERALCQTYHSPYELYYNQEKVVALSMRTNRRHIMIQGIIHCQPTAQFFSLPDPYKKATIQGIQTNIQGKILNQVALIQALSLF